MRRRPEAAPTCSWASSAGRRSTAHSWSTGVAGAARPGRLRCRASKTCLQRRCLREGVNVNA